MLARRQELNTQLEVVIDGFVLAVSLWVAWLLRYYSTYWFGLKDTVDPFHNYHWLFIVIMPFGPILLDLQGFYQSPLNKTKWRSLVQIVRAMIGLSIIVSACVIFLRFTLANRTVPLLFMFIGTIVLLLKERLMISYLRRKALRGEQREPVLLAGSPQDVSALEQSFPPEQRLLVDVVPITRKGLGKAAARLGVEMALGAKLRVEGGQVHVDALLVDAGGAERASWSESLALTRASGRIQRQPGAPVVFHGSRPRAPRPAPRLDREANPAFGTPPGRKREVRRRSLRCTERPRCA